ncbi:MAG TPA: DUF6445 family protein [Aliidongia sp.]|uniref:DUF6445 family protein n=1 Tax=Aliidongia sp. TaxID=1914230 RepID=UPI002DDC9944|nr:DUF6445 family protein [Aliidongia sp.]HEV2675841.1 DUF6445 family protein [Aliidongia sp.]
MNIRPFLHKDFRMRVDHIGHQQAPVVVIDNFLLDAAQMVEYAATGAHFAPAAALYPGVHAVMPSPYPMFVHFFTRSIIPEAFGLSDRDVVDCRCTFSMVTTRPDKVGVRQLVPHTDFLDPNHIVVLHYLYAKPHGGTAFYRHCATGYEGGAVDQRERYETLLKAELQAHPPTDYIRGDTPIFQQIASYDAVFNRAILYRSTSLHAATIPAEFSYDPDPRSGRLTANTMFFYGDQTSFFGPPRKPV